MKNAEEINPAELLTEESKGDLKIFSNEVLFSLFKHVDLIALSKVSKASKFYNNLISELHITCDKNGKLVTFGHFKEIVNSLPKFPLCILKDLINSPNFWDSLIELKEKFANVKKDNEVNNYFNQPKFNMPFFKFNMPFFTAMPSQTLNINISLLASPQSEKLSDYALIALHFKLIPRNDLNDSSIETLLESPNTAIPLLTGLYEKLFTVDQAKKFNQHDFMNEFGRVKQGPQP